MKQDMIVILDLGSTENTGNAIGLQSGLDDALSAGVDDSGGATRLANDTSSGQFLHVCFLLKYKNTWKNDLTQKFSSKF